MNNRLSQTKGRSKGRVASLNRSVVIESHLKRAQELAKQQDYKSAIFELRQAIKAYPNSILCHSTLSVLYFQAQQHTMASVHAKRTLALDPTNQLAMKIQQKLLKQKSAQAKRQQIQTEANEGGLFGMLTKKVF